VLIKVSYSVTIWLGRIGGVIIIAFGLYLMKLIQPKFLAREYKFQVKKKFKSRYLTAFVFGAAFAVGWTPCVGAILGAILTLAATQPSSALFLLLAYSLGLGVPFLLVGLFTNQAQNVINKAGKWLNYANFLFGALLVVIGIFVFTNDLSRIASFPIAADLLLKLNVDTVSFGSTLNIGVAFIAGIVSFLSPCVLPLIPAFLTFLASEVSQEGSS
jgi:cytochrome c-type biogenesis protein